MTIDNLVFSEKYRPNTLKDAILPTSVKKAIRDALDNNRVQNMLFSGFPGTGKCLDPSTVINLMVSDEIYQSLVENGFV